MFRNVRPCNFTSAGPHHHILYITANGQVVSFVSSAKLLGVTIQSNLRWDQQVDNMTTKANSKRYFLPVVSRAGVQTRDLTRFYTTFVRPTVEHVAPVWHASITAKQPDQLEVVLRSALRTIFSTSHTADSNSILACRPPRQACQPKTFAASSVANADLAHWFPSRRSDNHSNNLHSNYQRGFPSYDKTPGVSELYHQTIEWTSQCHKPRSSHRLYRLDALWKQYVHNIVN